MGPNSLMVLYADPLGDLYLTEARSELDLPTGLGIQCLEKFSGLGVWGFRGSGFTGFGVLGLRFWGLGVSGFRV